MHARRALAAGRALAAAFAAQELHEEARDVDHAGALVHDDHAARTHRRAELLEGLVVGGHVEQGGRHAAAGGAADLHGFDLVTRRGAPADGVDDLA